MSFVDARISSRPDLILFIFKFDELVFFKTEFIDVFVFATAELETEAEAEADSEEAKEEFFPTLEG